MGISKNDFDPHGLTVSYHALGTISIEELDERQQDQQEELQARIDEAVREREKELIAQHEARRALLRNDEQEFFEAARNQKLWQRRKFERGEMQKDFNDAAEFVEGAGRDDDSDERSRGWKRKADQSRSSYKPKSRRGRGFRRED